MKKTITMLLPVLLATMPVFGDWVKIDDFESAEIGDLDPNWHLYSNAEAGYDFAITQVIVDPARPDNQVLEFDPNSYNSGLNPFFGLIHDGGATGWSIPDGTEAMFYFRVYVAGPGNNIHVGMFDDYQDADGTDLTYDENGHIEAPGVGWTTADWFLRPSNRFGGQMDFRDGTRYVASDTFIMTSGWYEYWLLIRNGPGDSIQVDDYALWVKPLGGEIERVLIPEVTDGVYTGNYFDTSLYRDTTAKSLKYLMVAMNIGNSDDPVPGDPAYWDDFAIDNTATLDDPNLTTPSFAKLADSNPVSWFGGLVEPDGWVNTKAQLGWVYTGIWDMVSDSEFASAGYAFLYDLDSWKYIAGYVPQIGTWMYSWPEPGEPGAGVPEVAWHGYPLEVIEVPQLDADGNPVLDDQGNPIVGIKNDVDTGRFLGKIEVTYAPQVWSYHYNNWIWLDGDDYSGATWAYVAR